MTTDTSSDLKLIPFRPELGETFQRINEQWISSMFQMESSDEHLLANPQSAIVDIGGHIWFVEHRTRGVIGTAAIIPRRDGDFELTKMGVLEDARDLGAGAQGSPAAANSQPLPTYEFEVRGGDSPVPQERFPGRRGDHGDLR